MNTILQKQIIDKANDIINFNLVDLNDLVDRHDLFKMLIEIAAFALQNQWISVSEALPEKEGRYLCNYHYKFSNSEDECDCVDFGLFKDGKWYVANKEVTYWMPIPPLKGGGE